MQRHLVACLTVIGLIVGVSALRADPIVLYNTGVDPLTGGVDSHYSLVGAPGSPTLPGQLLVVTPGVFPLNGPWAPDSLASSWIAPASNALDGSMWNNLPGTYTFETTFTLAGVDPSDVKIQGIWGTDNAGVDIVLNGIVVAGPFAPGYPGFSAFNNPFTINNGFQLGTNTLDFVVSNYDGVGGNPTGLRVEMSGSVPEPATLSLLGLGLLGVGLLGRRRNAVR